MHMLFLRVAALVQVAFLPGYLLLVRAGVDRSHRLQTAVRTFAASLIVNWVLVYALTLSGLYRPSVLYVVFAAECAWFARLQWRKQLSGDLLGDAVELLRGSPWSVRLALVLALWTAGLFALYAVQNYDAVFEEWDAVVSWNRWALDWAHGHLPRLAFHYPQLVPASWSLIYVFAGDTVVQAPARILQALYPLGIVLTLLDAGIRHRSARVLLAVPIWGFLVHVMAAPWNALPSVLSSGWVDLPVAFFGLLAIVTALYAEERTERTWLLALFFACGAALTKQAGLYALVFVWVLALWDVRSRRFALRSAVLVLLLAGSWYAMKEVQIRRGLDDSEVRAVTVIVHAGRGALQRVEHAMALLRAIPIVGRLGWPGAILAAVLIALSLRDVRQRTLVLGLVVPFLTIWLFLYSYDTRNASLAVPFIALALAHGIPFDRVRLRTRLQVVAAAAAAIAVFGVFAYREEAARDGQLARQREIGDRGLNELLYGFFGAYPIHGKVLTGYQIMGFLPGFEDRIIVKQSLDVEDVFAAEQNPEIGYILQPQNWMTGDAWWLIQDRIQRGQYQLVFDQVAPTLGNFRMVQIRP